MWLLFEARHEGMTPKLHACQCQTVQSAQDANVQEAESIGM